MRDIVMAIKPRFAQAILNGTKKYEFRKTAPAKEWSGKIYLYETAPTSAIVGYFEVCDAPDEHVVLYFISNEFSGFDGGLEALCAITKKELIAYAGGVNQFLYAWHVGEVHRFDKPLPIQGSVPQSWRYAKNGEIYE
jgi:predicted transcriptional regulator